MLCRLLVLEVPTSSGRLSVLVAADTVSYRVMTSSA
jgi:hypothetical protein